MKLRKLEAKDFSEWKLLWDDYQTFYHNKMDETVSLKTFERLLSDIEPMHCILAEKEGLIVGLVHFIYHESTWTIGNYCYLQDLFVSVKTRKNGIGKALIEQVYAMAKQNECSRVYWLTQETNYAGRSLYDTIADKTEFVQYRKMM